LRRLVWKFVQVPAIARQVGRRAKRLWASWPPGDSPWVPWEREEGRGGKMGGIWGEEGGKRGKRGTHKRRSKREGQYERKRAKCVRESE
jgi:hypothetical protein